ncbi:MAG TPA: hypothetical protein VFL34_19530 [Candidatus Sulfotelmatobacter sp.]|nr:hypothetical protein [Candidatus Sulfotelmatobacter sp.]
MRKFTDLVREASGISVVLSPLRGWLTWFAADPTACAVGCNLAPLRGLSLGHSLQRTAARVYEVALSESHAAAGVTSIPDLNFEGYAAVGVTSITDLNFKGYAAVGITSIPDLNFNCGNRDGGHRAPIRFIDTIDGHKNLWLCT